MIIDTSAIVAILRSEPDGDRLLAVLSSADEVLMSSATWLEASMVLETVRNPNLNREFQGLLADVGVQIIPVTAEHARIARDANRDFGKRSGHPARLNFGDLFAYALASERRQPLLFVGDDFIHTDIEPADII